MTIEQLLRDFVRAVEAGAVEVSSPEIGGEFSTQAWPWHEEWLNHVRDALKASPHPDALAAAELKLSKLDQEAIRRHAKRMDDLAEIWFEEARQLNAEQDQDGEMSMMAVSNIFTAAGDKLTALLREVAPQHKEPTDGR